MAHLPDMLVARYALDSLTIPVVRLRDPRSGRDDSFAFQWHLEQALYGGATGGLYRLLQRASLSGCTLTLSKASVSAGAVTTEQLRELIALLSESLPLESQARPRTNSHELTRPRTPPLFPFLPESDAPVLIRCTLARACTGSRSPSGSISDQPRPCSV